MNYSWNDTTEGLTDKVNTYRLALDIMLYFRSMETNETRDSLLFFMSVLFSKVIAFSCNYWKSNIYTVTAWSQIFALFLILTLVKVANLDILIWKFCTVWYKNH